MRGLIVCGDKRSAYLLDELIRNGIRMDSYGVYRTAPLADGSACTIGFDKAGNLVKEEVLRQKNSVFERMEEYDFISLPVPVTKDGHTLKTIENGPTITQKEFMEHIKAHHLVFGGNIPKEWMEHTKARFHDLLTNDGIAIKNAVATAEGAIAEAICHSECNLHGKKVLVMGYGRCGKILAWKLKGMDSKVTVLARRKEALYEADAYGFETLLLSECKNLNEFSYIFNTIPKPVFTKAAKESIAKDCRIFELAGRECILSEEEKMQYAGRFYYLPGLPGRYAPKESGEILAEYILEEIWK